MNPCIVYFSRTGNTKRLAEAIAAQTKAPLYSITDTQPSVVEAYDTIILGTPIEGASPAKETKAFIDQLPSTQGKKVVIFCTYGLFGNERAMKAMEKILAEKGYETILKTSMKGMKPEKEADFTENLKEVQKALQL
jgi:flavodoxin